MNFFNAKASRHRSVTIQLLALLLLSLGSRMTHAYSCSGGPVSVVLNLPGTVSVARDMATGTLLTSWVYAPATTNYFTCSASSENMGVTGHLASGSNFNVASGQLLTGSAGAPSIASYTVYNTNIPGVGMAIAYRNYNGFNGNGWTSAGVASPGWINAAAGWHGIAWSGQSGTQSLGAQAAIALVKTGVVTQGGVIPSSLVVESGFTQASWGAPTAAMMGRLVTFTTTAVTVVPLACTTPNVVVPLGSHSSNEMGAIGATTQAVAFDISLNGCPGGMNGIQYRIDPATTVVNRTQSIVALDGSSSATGVAVQLLNTAGTAAFPLSSYQTFSGYSKSTGGSYSIPFKARYYRTGAITPGAANTSMTFTMQYL